jgi:hypothetical protein
MAMTAWLAKVRIRSTCCSSNASGSAHPTVMAPIGSPARSMGMVTWLRVLRASIICRDRGGTFSSLAMSRMKTGSRVRMARPAMVSSAAGRGNTCWTWPSPLWLKPCDATRWMVSPS